MEEGWVVVWPQCRFRRRRWAAAPTLAGRRPKRAHHHPRPFLHRGGREARTGVLSETNGGSARVRRAVAAVGACPSDRPSHRSHGGQSALRFKAASASGTRPATTKVCFRPLGDVQRVRFPGRDDLSYVREMDEAAAIALVKARLVEIGEQGFTYPLAGVREHPETWAVAVQPTRPDGQPLYDLMGFDVNKVTGEVCQTL